MFPLPLARGRVREGAAPPATSAVYHRQDAPFLAFPPPGGKDTGSGGGIPCFPSPPAKGVARSPLPPPRPANGVPMFPLPLARGRVREGGRSPCGQCRILPAGRPLPSLPPAGGKGHGVRLAVRSQPRAPSRRAPRPARQPTQSQKSPKSNESQYKTTPPSTTPPRPSALSVLKTKKLRVIFRSPQQAYDVK